MKLLKRWKHTSLPNKLLVVASTLMALGSLSSGVVAYFQYRMLQKQSMRSAVSCSRHSYNISFP